jgi:hypothetical protein
VGPGPTPAAPESEFQALFGSPRLEFVLSIARAQGGVYQSTSFAAFTTKEPYVSGQSSWLLDHFETNRMTRDLLQIEH